MWKWLELTWEAAKIGDNKVWMKKGTQLQTKRIKKGKKNKGNGFLQFNPEGLSF